MSGLRDSGTAYARPYNAPIANTGGMQCIGMNAAGCTDHSPVNRATSGEC